MPAPLNSLYSNPNEMPVHSYPSDLGSSRKGHYIAFTISTPTKSMFTGETTSATPTTPTNSLSSTVGQLESTLNNVASAAQGVTSTINEVAGTVSNVVGAASSVVNSTLSTFNTVVGSAASVAGAVSGVSQIASAAAASGSVLGGIQAGVTAISAAGTVLNTVSGLASQADTVIGSAGKFLSDPMGSISSAYDSLKNALTSTDKLSISSGFKGSKVNPEFKPATLKPTGYINLYTPDTISMNQKASYQSVSGTSALGLFGMGSEAESKLNSTYDKITQDGVGSIFSKSTLADPLAQEIGGLAAQRTKLVGNGFTDYLLNQSGYAINPQLEVLFSRMEFRTFQFTFTFTPKSKQEAKSVNEIIKLFRVHAAPEMDTSGGGRYFIVPSVFNIQYMFADAVKGKSGPNKNLHNFAPCVLTSILVDYAPDVGWVTHDDGMPVKTTLILQFQEIEVLTKENIITKGY